MPSTYPRRERLAPMSADDPRHGTYAGANAHWMAGERTSDVCPPCRLAATNYSKIREYRQLKGHRATVPGVGYIRRVRALQRLGYSIIQIADAAGVPESRIYYLVDRFDKTRHSGSGRPAGQKYVRADTAAAILTAYEKLCMTVPVGGYSLRARNLAARNGWPPPLAWVNIDDPAENPQDYVYKPVVRTDTTRLHDLEHLMSLGMNLAAVCKKLGIEKKALEKWCSNHDRTDIYQRLLARQRTQHGANQSGVYSQAS